jgi:hypothetical protein
MTDAMHCWGRGRAQRIVVGAAGGARCRGRRLEPRATEEGGRPRRRWPDASIDECQVHLHRGVAYWLVSAGFRIVWYVLGLRGVRWSRSPAFWAASLGHNVGPVQEFEARSLDWIVVSYQLGLNGLFGPRGIHQKFLNSIRVSRVATRFDTRIF